MRKQHPSVIIHVIALSIFMFIAAQPVLAESLYEFYTTATKEALDTETGNMGSELAKTFSQNKITKRQQQIDFSEYYANLKKMVFFANKLSTYSDYQEDLRFARDKELFQGLPESTPSSEPEQTAPKKKQFVQNKYERMKKNVEEEIETYEDLIQISLDACESLSRNDLSGFLTENGNRGRIEALKEEALYQTYLQRHDQLAGGWPEFANRIDGQFNLWVASPLSASSPIIDPAVTGAI